MRVVPGVFLATDGSGMVATGHRILCITCDNDAFRINVIYLTSGEHTHLTCTQCGSCFCDNRCSDGDTIVPPAKTEGN